MTTLERWEHWTWVAVVWALLLTWYISWLRPTVRLHVSKLQRKRWMVSRNYGDMLEMDVKGLWAQVGVTLVIVLLACLLTWAVIKPTPIVHWHIRTTPERVHWYPPQQYYDNHRHFPC